MSGHRQSMNYFQSSFQGLLPTNSDRARLTKSLKPQTCGFHDALTQRNVTKYCYVGQGV